MTKLCELQFYFGCDVGELVGRILKMDRFQINQQKFNNSLELWAITTISLSFQYGCEMLTESP